MGDSECDLIFFRFKYLRNSKSPSDSPGMIHFPRLLLGGGKSVLSGMKTPGGVWPGTVGGG